MDKLNSTTLRAAPSVGTAGNKKQGSTVVGGEFVQ